MSREYVIRVEPKPADYTQDADDYREKVAAAFTAYRVQLQQLTAK